MNSQNENQQITETFKFRGSVLHCLTNKQTGFRIGSAIGWKDTPSSLKETSAGFRKAPSVFSWPCKPPRVETDTVNPRSLLPAHTQEQGSTIMHCFFLENTQTSLLRGGQEVQNVLDGRNRDQQQSMTLQNSSGSRDATNRHLYAICSSGSRERESNGGHHCSCRPPGTETSETNDATHVPGKVRTFPQAEKGCSDGSNSS